MHDEKLHRHLGELWLTLKNYPGAIRRIQRAVLALNPLDRATGAQYNLAQRLFRRRAGATRPTSTCSLRLRLLLPIGRLKNLLLQLHDLEKGN